VVVTPDAPSEMAGAICRLASAPLRCQEMSHRARNLVLRRFDRRRLAEEIEAILLAVTR
jgi:glycosyltransferase involved in cell wall biosynthesis